MSIYKSDVNDGIHMSIPQTPDKQISLFLWNALTMMPPPLISTLDLVNEKFVLYTFRVEGLYGELDDHVTYIIVVCDEETSTAAA